MPTAPAALICLVLLAGLVTPSVAAEADRTAGREAYLQYCARCHQRDGRGIAGMFPDLHDLAATPAERTRVIRTLLAGRDAPSGPDAGGGFDAAMPSHGFLGNETIAATLSYLLAEWSSAGDPVSAEAVAEVRLALLAGHPAGLDPDPGPSPLADMAASQYVTSEGPALTVEAFDRARRIYYGRCTGCHGVLREGTAGNPLTPELMRGRGSEYLRSVISYGSSTGMPNWGTSETLSAEDIDLLVKFLQHPVPQPPDLDLAQIRDTWDQRRPPAERPTRPEHDYDLDDLFVVTLHDVGEIGVLEGVGKTLLATVPVGRAPQRIAASASGRYLYVIDRDGTVSLVDLYAWPPERVASVRIGFEARALAAARYPGHEDRFVMAGAYWPPQLVLLDGRSLEPLRLISTRGGADGGRYHPEPRVSDVAGSTRHPEFIGQVRETGQVYLVRYDGTGGLVHVTDLDTVDELRAGAFSSDGRYYLTPADSNAVSVLDVENRRIVAEIPARMFGGNPGTAYVHDTFGPVMAFSTMVGGELLLVGTDPENRPDSAWQIVQRVDAPASGSLFAATHPASEHLWLDTPLNGDDHNSQSIAVYRRDALDEPPKILPAAAWSGLTIGARRVVQPAFSRDGREVWLVVWNPQDQGAAIVVVDDASLEPVASIRAPGLITPTRIYSVAALRAAGAAAPAPVESSGADLYARHCTGCHGLYGEGDGPAAAFGSTALKDLRRLSVRNAGTFPESFVRAVIDGRTMPSAHRREAMPLWGAEWGAVLGADKPDSASAAEPAAQNPIDALVEFLATIQIDPENEDSDVNR